MLLAETCCVNLHFRTRKNEPDAIRVPAAMTGSDEIMATTLFLGTYPGLTSSMIEKEISVISSFINTAKLAK